MKNNDKKETIETILTDLGKRSNDISLIKDNIIKLMEGEAPVKSLIYYLDKCNPIKLLIIKANLENYKEISKFKRDVFISITALIVSMIFSGIAILLNVVEDKNIFFYIGCAIEVLLVGYLLYHAIKFTDIKGITKLENDIEVVLYLVNFILENKKEELKNNLKEDRNENTVEIKSKVNKKKKKK